MMYMGVRTNFSQTFKRLELHLQAYKFFGTMTMFPLMIAYFMLILACLCTGKKSKNFTHKCNISSERQSSLKIKGLTLLLAILGIYPQYRSVRTILIGWGFIQGDWQAEHKFNSRKLYIIEPLVESLLQVPMACSELCF